MLLDWLNRRVELLVKYKANCRNMALALVKDQTDYADKLKTWRKLAQVVLAQRAIKDLQFARKLNQLILKEFSSLLLCLSKRLQGIT